MCIRDRARDSSYNRHMAQLAAGYHLFLKETNTLKRLSERGITTVTGALLYANNQASSLYPLPAYWEKRASGIVDLLRSQ